jgi:hypothetical protein
MKLSYAPAIVTLFVGIAVFIGYLMWYAAVANESATVAGLQSQIITKTEDANRIASALVALSGISGDENIVQNYFVPETKVVPFINNVEERGKALGTSISVLSVSTNIVNKQPTILFTLSISGTFDSVLRTVGVIEYLPYDLSITDFSVVQGDKDIWNANLKILVGSVKTPTP